MKKISWAAIFVIFFLSGFSQANYSWFPVHPGVQYNYRVDTAVTAISEVVKIDSISASGLTYHLNKIVTRCDTCHNAQLFNNPNDSTYTLNQQPQFLNHAFIVTPGNGFYFKGHFSFVIYPMAAQGSSWMYDTLQNISATLFLKNIQTILGNSDSVSCIKLSTGDTLAVSKNHGVVKFPFKAGMHRSYALVGAEGPTISGIRLKRFHDFFDLQAGDVLQYEFTDEDYNLFPPQFIAGHERLDILSSTVYADSVRCLARKTYVDSVRFGGGAAVVTAYTSTITLTFKDSLQHLANAYPHQEITVNPYFIFNNGVRHIHTVMQGLSNGRATRQFGQTCPSLYLSGSTSGAAMATSIPNLFLNRNYEKITGFEVTEGLGITSELYNDYDRIHQRCLVGYVKNSDTSGILYPDLPTGIKNNTLAAGISVFPVPASGQVLVSGTLPAQARLSIINSLGEIVLSQPGLPQKTQALNTASLLNGMYFIVISNPYLSVTKKLVIQH